MFSSVHIQLKHEMWHKQNIRAFVEDVHKYSIDQGVKKICIEKEQQNGEEGGEWEAD